MKGVYRYVDTCGEVTLLLIVGTPFEYNRGRPETTLVPGLVLFSEVSYHKPGTVKNFATVCIKPFASEEKSGTTNS